MNISLPDDMKDWVDAQVRENGYASISEYIRFLIRQRRNQIEELRAKVIQSIDSSTIINSHDKWLIELRNRIDSNTTAPAGWFDEEFFDQMLKRISAKSEK